MHIAVDPVPSGKLKMSTRNEDDKSPSYLYRVLGSLFHKEYVLLNRGPEFKIIVFFKFNCSFPN